MGNLIYFYARFLGIFLFKFLFHLRVYGRENLKDVGSSCIIAANHQSYLDPLVLGLSFPRKLKYFAKADIFNIPFLAFLIRHLGAIPIERDIMSSMTMRHGVKILKEKNWLVIFPEGTRSRTGKMASPKQGIGFLHYKSGAPILPVRMEGTGRALPVDSRFIRPLKIRVFIGKKIEMKVKDYNAIAQRVIDEIKGLK